MMIDPFDGSAPVDDPEGILGRDRLSAEPFLMMIHNRFTIIGMDEFCKRQMHQFLQTVATQFYSAGIRVFKYPVLRYDDRIIGAFDNQSIFIF